MKILSTTFLLCLMAASTALAQTGKGSEPTAKVYMQVIDKDPNGTNVRETPGGKIRRVIPFISGNKSDDYLEMRRVLVTGGGKKGWFTVRLSDDDTGWMHRSVLGACASATEDGDPFLSVNPNYNAAGVAMVKAGTRLKFLDAKGTWAKVSYKDSAGKEMSGWMPEQTLYGSCF